ncbi:MAG: hypothetical protein OEY49_08825 [Candidatus Heimdallarchaeota archaeon]|nr:hypothetical protein [Candidatus Heimdallarchaeota archaeon]
MSDEEKGMNNENKDLGKKALEYTKKGVKFGIKAGIAVKDTLNEVAEENRRKQQELLNTHSKNDNSNFKVVNQLQNTGRGIENQVQTWYGWFWSIITYLFVIIISFLISQADSRFRLLPILLIIGFPFFLYWAIINSIPEIKIGNKILFSKNDLSIRNQLSFGSTIARTFSKEMIRNSPEGAAIIGLFIILLLYVLISPFFILSS